MVWIEEAYIQLKVQTLHILCYNLVQVTRVRSYAGISSEPQAR